VKSAVSEKWLNIILRDFLRLYVRFIDINVAYFIKFVNLHGNGKIHNTKYDFYKSPRQQRTTFAEERSTNKNWIFSRNDWSFA